MKFQNIIICISVSLIIAALVLHNLGLTAAVMAAVILIVLFDRSALRYIIGRKFWIIMALTAVTIPFLFGKKDIIIAGAGYSSDMFILLLRMGMRGFLVFSGMTLIRRHVPPSAIAGWLLKFGFNQLAVIIPMSLQLVPALLESSRVIYDNWAHRGGWRRNRMRNLRLLLESLMLGWVQQAEDLTLALALERMERSNNKSASKEESPCWIL
ncbi:hypothetical protein ISS30_09930 [bacterium]|nr:hypothetical protein [bacterium]